MPPPADADRGTTAVGLRGHLREHAALVLVLLAFVGAAFLIPTLAPVAINDDFLYSRSVEILVRDHDVRVLPAAAMTLVFQIAWGGLFASIFGDSLGVLRAATVTFAGIGGLAMYALCRELRVSRLRSALGAAVLLFNPISFALGYTFMTDTYLLTLVTVALWCYVRGMRSVESDVRWTIAGSVATGLAFLVRQPGILVAVGVVTYLLATRQLRWDRASARTLARVAVAPVLMVVGYGLWSRFAHGVPQDSGQAGSLHAIGDAGPRGAVALARRLAVILVVYIGLFVLPIALGVIPRVPRLVRTLDRTRVTVVAAVLAIPALLTVGVFAPFTARRPWVGQYFGAPGAGPIDIRGGRPTAVSPGMIDVLLVLAVAATLVAAVCVLHRLGPLERRRSVPGLGLLACVGVWLAVAVLPQSMPLRETSYSYDRYFLPLLPIVVAALLVTLRPVRIVEPLAWAAVVVMGTFSVAATHDHLTLQRATWQLAAEAHAAGVPLTSLDGGAAWDGYHLYESTHATNAPVDLSKLRGLGFNGPIVLSEHDRGAWWIPYYAHTVKNRVVVSTDRLYGYDVVDTLEYSSWLHRDPQVLYLLRMRG